MKTKIFVPLLILIPIIISAQNEKLNDPIYITIDELKDHMYYLASDALKGRSPGEDGYLKAVEYAVSQFKQAKLKPLFVDESGDSTHLQKISFKTYTWDTDNSISIKNRKSKKQEYRQGINYLVFNGKPFDLTELSGNAVFVSSGIREPEYGFDNFANVNVKGKWVIFYIQVEWLDKFLPPDVILEKYTDPLTSYHIIDQNAMEAGAIGLIGLADKRMSPHMKRAAEDFKMQIEVQNADVNILKAKLPLVIVDSFVASSIFIEQRIDPYEKNAVYESFELKKTKITLNKNTTIQEFDSYNVGALLPGIDPSVKDEYISLGAHLDHLGAQDDLIFNGADDNASGSIGVIEIAEEMAQKGSKRPILFLLYTAEEMGLIGSEYFVTNPPIPLSQIKININLDMISRSDGDVERGIAPIYSDKISTNFKNELIEINQKFPIVELDWAYADSSTVSSLSDHFSFHKRNIPAICFFVGLHDDYHNAGDEPEKVDYEYFLNNCRFIFHVIYSLSNKEKLQLISEE